MKACPPSSVLQKITQEKIQLLLAQRSVIDADAIAYLTIQVFVTYVFGPKDEHSTNNNNNDNNDSNDERKDQKDSGPWAQGKEKELNEMYQTLVQASWEWRKEIAVRGKGNMEIKQAAIRVVTEQLLPHTPHLWALFGEKWREPRYYSLVRLPHVFVTTPLPSYTLYYPLPS